MLFGIWLTLVVGFDFESRQFDTAFTAGIYVEETDCNFFNHFMASDKHCKQDPPFENHN